VGDRVSQIVGIMNASSLFGAAIFFTFGAGPAIFSKEMEHALQLKPDLPFAYFAGGSHSNYRQLLSSPTCGAGLWRCCICCRAPLSGQISRLPFARFADGAALNQSPGRLLVAAKLKKFAYDTLQSQHSSETREAARESFRTWHGFSQIVNCS